MGRKRLLALQTVDGNKEGEDNVTCTMATSPGISLFELEDNGQHKSNCMLAPSFMNINGIARTLKKLCTSKGDYCNKQ